MSILAPFFIRVVSTLFNGAAKTVVANVNSWKSFCPDLFKTFQHSVSWNTSRLNQTKGFSSYFNPWWLALFANVLNLYFLPYYSLGLFSYLAVSSRASHVGSFLMFFTYLSTLFECKCSTFRNFCQECVKDVIFLLLYFWTFYQSEGPLKYLLKIWKCSSK